MAAEVFGDPIVPKWVHTFKGEMNEEFHEAYTAAVKSLKPDAGPGIPFCYDYTTNRQVVKHVEQLEQLVLERMTLLSTEGELPDAFGKAAGGFCDPARVFVKNELHTRVKLIAGRYRLIMGVSIVDQLVERMLFGEQNKLEIENWEGIPSKPGMGLDDASLKKLSKEIYSFLDPVGADVQGFDWSVKEWELCLFAEFRAMSGPPMYKVLCMNRLKCLADTLLVTSDGSVWLIPPGVMKSGSYLTSAGNSFIRWMIAIVCGSKRAMAMGDDCIEEYCDDAHAKYMKLGHPLKYYKRVCGDAEFCSHIFPKDGSLAYCAEPEKLFFRLMAKSLVDAEMVRELWSAFLLNVRNYTGAAMKYTTLAVALRWPVPKYIRQEEW